MEKLYQSYLLFFVAAINLRNLDALCTFPDELNGTWYSSVKGVISFNNTHLLDYPIYLSATVQSMDFFCDQKNGDLYMLKSITDVYAFQAALIEAYICVQFERVSAYKYKYFLGTALTTTNNDFMYGALSGTSVDMATACNRPTPYDEATFITLFKEGTLYSGEAQATCPHALLSAFSSITITDSTSSTTCQSNAVTGCDDRTQLKYTYQSCTTGLTFSSGGLFYCIHEETVDGVTYVILYNNDTTVDGTTTYRHTCMAFTESGSDVYATELPNFCSDESMTSTAVTSPGIKYTMTSKTEDCYSVVTGGKSGGYYALIIFLVLAIAIMVFVGIVVCKKYKNKIRMMELAVYTRETMKTPGPSTGTSTPNLDKSGKGVSSNNLDIKTADHQY